MMDKVFYNKNGKPVVYVIGEDIYSFDGVPLAYLNEGSFIYSYSGKHLGWFDNGWIIDLKGTYVFFSDGASGGPIQPLKQILPVRNVRGIKPIKSIREMRNLKPVKTNTWSSFCDLDFFKQ